MSRGASRPDELHWAALSCVAERNNKQIVELRRVAERCPATRGDTSSRSSLRCNKQIVELRSGAKRGGEPKSAAMP